MTNGPLGAGDATPGPPRPQPREARSSLAPAQFPRPLPGWGSTLALVHRMQWGWGSYPISRWPGVPLGRAILTLLPLWTQTSFRTNLLLLVNSGNSRHSALRPKGPSSETRSSRLRVTDRKTEAREGRGRCGVKGTPGHGTRNAEHRTALFTLPAAGHRQADALRLSDGVAKQRPWSHPALQGTSCPDLQQVRSHLRAFSQLWNQSEEG